jgi:hypothetical protein
LLTWWDGVKMFLNRYNGYSLGLEFVEASVSFLLLYPSVHQSRVCCFTLFLFRSKGNCRTVPLLFELLHTDDRIFAEIARWLLPCRSCFHSKAREFTKADLFCFVELIHMNKPQFFELR